jgi:hypothetical protein
MAGSPHVDNLVRTPRAPIWTHVLLDEPPAHESGPPVSCEPIKKHWGDRYPATKGRAGGKLPVGKGASRSPRLNLSDASRKAPEGGGARLFFSGETPVGLRMGTSAGASGVVEAFVVEPEQSLKRGS